MADQTNTRITLKGLKYFASMSEETHCFEATVLLDGKPAFVARNRGHGGSDDYYPIKGQKPEDYGRLLREAEEYAGSLPGTQFHDVMLPTTLESVVCELVNVTLALKDMRRLMKKYFLGRKPDGKIYQWKLTERPDTMLPILKAKFPDTKFLNDLAESEALKIFRGAA